jgi:predicted GIY-YIG superfamily endonuclease
MLIDFWNRLEFTEGIMSDYKGMSEEVGIYCLINMVTKKLYIGKTKNLRKRIYSHVKDSERPSNTKLYNAIKKYGVFAFKVHFVYEREEDIEELELDYIDLVKALKKDSYNLVTRHTKFNNRIHRTPNSFKNRNEKAVVLCDKITGEFYQRFNSYKDAAKHLKALPCNIAEIVRKGISYQCKGYVAIKETEYDSTKLYKQAVIKQKRSETHKKARLEKISRPVTLTYKDGTIKNFKSRMELSYFLNCPIHHTNPNFWYMIYKQHSEIENIY